MNILLVEDNAGDVRLAQEACRASNKAITLYVVRDGIEAMDYLRQEGTAALATRPHLILLDLNLPRMNGREVLAEIKHDAALMAIPTIVLTASDNEDDVDYCYENHVNCYLIKPGNLDAFVHLVTAINHFWSILLAAPSKTAPGMPASAVVAAAISHAS